MPERKTIQRAKKLAREGKAPSTQAGEFVHEEIEHIRKGKHGAKNAKQAIAIGLSKARRAGVKLPAKRGSSQSAEAPRKGSTPKRRAKRSTKKATTKPRRSSAKRGDAALKALKRAPRSAASPRALSRQARQSARRRKRTSAPRSRTKRASA